MNVKSLTKIQETNQVKFFKFYGKLPFILAICILAFFFILAIALAVGVGFGAFLLCTLLGILFSVVVYFISRIAFSYQILHILYLQKLLGDKVSSTNHLETHIETPQIVPSSEQ